MKICLIGNSGALSDGRDGQTYKVRIYKKKIEDEGFDLFFVDLSYLKKNPIKCLRLIKLGIKISDRIILITGERGCRVFIPFINRLNRKYNKPFVLPVIGIGPLHDLIDSVDDYSKMLFLSENGRIPLNSRKILKVSKQLKRISFILPETHLLVRLYKDMFSLNNVIRMVNFREGDYRSNCEHIINNKILKIVYMSRINKVKGIFDVIEAVNLVNENNTLINVDFYGIKQLSELENKMFDDYMKYDYFNYRGSINNTEAINVLQNYDLFVFPTRYLGEGIPGVIIEALIAGTPILSSRFPQGLEILKEGKEAIFYNMFDINDLKDKLYYITSNKNILPKMGSAARKKSNMFNYRYNRGLFLKYVCGMRGISDN